MRQCWPYTQPRPAGQRGGATVAVLRGSDEPTQMNEFRGANPRNAGQEGCYCCHGTQQPAPALTRPHHRAMLVTHPFFNSGLTSYPSTNASDANS